jgi:predicted cobalt transporter CbtA
VNPGNEKDDYRRIALSIASLGTLIGVLNASTLIIALPTIMVDLNTDLIGVMWVLIIYMLRMYRFEIGIPPENPELPGSSLII